jgi:hypothetical protein
VISKKRSDQPRCCGNPSWATPAGIHGGWLQCNIQVVCQLVSFIKMLYFNGLGEADQQAKTEFQPILAHKA